MSKKAIAYVISHSHWDREWRVPIWRSRQRLIKMMKTLLDALEQNIKYRGFLLDGQVIAIEDYLESCPEDWRRVKRFVENQKLFIGPWYNLPDEYPLDGECLVRNLLWGINRAEKFGGAMKIGYTSFGWGQTAQLPQIYSGFDIDFIIIGKHISKDLAHNSEFLWKSPDGTEVLTTRLGKSGRANFYFDAILPVFYGMKYRDKRWGLGWPGNGWRFHPANSDDYYLEHSMINDFKEYNHEMLKSCLEDVWETTADSLVKNHRFFGDGCDYTGPTKNLENIIEDANKLNLPFRLMHSTLPEYVNILKTELDLGELIVIEGELRDGPVAACSGNALATRMPLKILNRFAQKCLIKYTEPLAVLAQQIGIVYPDKFINEAWRYLLQSHSHDAINGVTLDKTSDDITYRLSQTIELSHVAYENCVQEILKRVVIHANDDEILLAVFNPITGTESQVVEAVIDLPSEMHSKYLKLVDLDDNQFDVQHLELMKQTIPVYVENSRAVRYSCDRHRIVFDTGKLPSLGYKIFKVNVLKKYDGEAHFWPEDIDFGSQVTGPNEMANNFIKVKINGDGTFNLLDKVTGQIYKNLNYFEDSGDSGDYWQRVEPLKNKIVTSLGCSAEISLSKDGPLLTEYTAEIDLMVPVDLDYSKQTRSSNCEILKISSKIILKYNNPFVEIKTSIKNTVCAHRLRVCMPTYLDANYSMAEGHFGIDKRFILKPKDKNQYCQSQMSTLPQQRFVTIDGSSAGLTVLNKNIIEYEIVDNESRTIALTLLRCVPVRICSEYRCALTAPEQQGSQCIGSYTFDYAIYPHISGLKETHIYKVADKFNYLPRVFQFSNPKKGNLLGNLSFFEIQNDQLQLSAIKKSENSDGIIIRLFNPTDSKIDTQIKFIKSIKYAHLVKLNENYITDLEINDNLVKIEANAKKIITLKLVF